MELRSVSFDFLAANDLPDIMEFLTQHGLQLTFLDLNFVPTLEIAAILDLCPFLTTFIFNADWYLHTLGDDSPSDVVNRPHQNITEIAFGVGYGTSQIHTNLIQPTNGRNMAALTKDSFPNLKTVRALSRPLLMALEKNDGPEEGCRQRWDSWWAQFSKMGVRLEDCTGALLGTLPSIPEDMEDGEKDEEDIESDSDEEEDIIEGPLCLRPNTVHELRQLLEECRRMAEQRDEPNMLQIGWH